MPFHFTEIAEERSAAARAAEAREIEVRAVEQRSAIEAAYSDAEMQVNQPSTFTLNQSTLSFIQPQGFPQNISREARSVRCNCHY